MVKTGKFKKTVCFILSVIISMVTFCSLVIGSFAASYSPIKLDVPRISQRPNTGDCAIASISSVEAYFYDLPSGDYNSSIYQDVYSANGNSISAKWSTLGYKKISGFDMKTIYSQLITGYPVIVNRTSAHYSVIYGYQGSTSALEMSGFLIFDVDDSYSDTTSKKTLDKWVGNYSIDQMVLRCDGLAIPVTNITINGNHPADYHIKGSTFSVYGTVVSRYTISSVKTTITNSSGAIAQSSSYTATPNTKSFTISSCDSNMNFGKLAVGKYKYSVTAKDSSGATASYSYDFNVVEAEADVPVIPSNPDNNDIKYTSYKATVNADPSLNLRTGAGTSYSIITSIPLGTVVEVKAENSGWGQVTYSGKTGWVSLDYLTEYISDSLYARIVTATYIRKTPSSYATGEVFLPKNTIVKAYEKSNNFLKVSYNGVTGWVYSPYAVDGIGDLDGNGKIDSGDALSILNYSIGSVNYTALQKQVSDLNGDSEINSLDALIALQISVGVMKI